MRQLLRLLILLSTLIGCERNKVDLPATTCPYADSDIRRGSGPVTDVAAIIVVRKSGTQPLRHQLLPVGTTDPTSWGPCYLPQAFQKDSLMVYVSGYFLTSPFLELANVNPIPFEITAIRVR